MNLLETICLKQIQIFLTDAFEFTVMVAMVILIIARRSNDL